MTRSVAKVQVQMGTAPSDVTGNFNAENVTYQIYNFARSGYVQPGPTPAGIPTSSPVNDPKSFNILQKEGATEAKTNAFIYEYPSSNHTIASNTNDIGKKNFNISRQHIVLTKDDGANPKRYYRLDFYNPVDSTFLDTERNHHYIFTINKVRSEGYTTLGEAQGNPGSNMEYTVRIEDGSQSITSNGQYAIVTSVDTVRLTKGTVTDETVTFYYINPAGVQKISVNSISVESSQPGNALTIEPAGQGSITKSYPSYQNLKITATNLQEGVILFEFGNITHRLHVKVLPSM
jgi:hypothetical protein